jgi:hypothetical protein
MVGVEKMKKHTFDSFEGLQEWMNDKNLFKSGVTIIMNLTELGLEVYFLQDVIE